MPDTPLLKLLESSRSADGWIHIFWKRYQEGWQVIGQSNYEFSGDDKTLTAKVKGIDASGTEVEQVIVFDRE